MKLKNKIQQDIIKALKKKETEKLSSLRFLKAQIKDKEIERGREELTDEDIIKLISNQVKKLKENLELFKKGEREDLIKKTEAEIKLLKTYLPNQLSDKELEKEIEDIIRQNPDVPHPGALIGICVKKLAGKAENKKISKLVMKKIGK